MARKKSRLDARGAALAGLLSTTGSDRKGVRTVEVTDDQPRETLQSFRAKFDAEQKAEHERRVAAEKAVAGQKLFTEPSQTLASKIPVFVRGNRPQSELTALATNAYTAAKAKLESDGYIVSPQGWERVASVIKQNDSLSYDQPSAWVTTVLYMLELGVLDSSECLSLNEPEAQPAPVAPPQKFDDLDTQSAREVVLSACQGEARIWFDAFAASLQRNFNYILSDAEVAAIIKVMERGLQFNRAADWDRARLVCVSNGSLPQHLKYPAELLNEKLEDANMDDFEQKQAYRREFYKLQQ